MAAPEDEAVQIFSDLRNAFEALKYSEAERTRIQALLRQTEAAVRLALGDDSAYLDELRAIKLLRPRANASNRERYFEIDRQRAVGMVNSILVNLRLSSEQRGSGRAAAKRGKRANTVRPGYVFIAMSMNPDDPSLEDVHEAIKEVASGLGLTAERADDPITNEQITDRIVESLERAEYVVVDLTHSRPNVYWEAGYAQALGTTPVYLARKGTTIEFDLKDYPVIFFANLTQLKRELKKRLSGLQASKSKP